MTADSDHSVPTLAIMNEIGGLLPPPIGAKTYTIAGKGKPRLAKSPRTSSRCAELTLATRASKERESAWRVPCVTTQPVLYD
eukprot:CAMPEP_0196804768 /NCGR_PEP_ID=MMETSP1362-20130617/4428_1 /TAXON_ID=163516 /ORGANISM="Leptocylindrus danicus, Strain CCMP1856" /LENGTH=81 /DNA_ID=CAMNT_0042177265 /DNA_START=1359 /DNA_END=1601 /DNA_ORIENTATION=-